MHPEFSGSPQPTLGVEFESTIVDRETFAVASIASQIVAELPESLERGDVSCEVYESQIEMVTGICRTTRDVRDDLRSVFAVLQPILASRGAGLLGMGSHPTCDIDELVLRDADRVRHLVNMLAWPLLRIYSTGIHVHVGVPDGDTAMRVIRRMAEHLPVLLALSAASPYRTGRDTGMASSRISAFESVPRSGLFPDVRSWDECNQMYSTLARAGSIEYVNDVWWDQRPNATLGTVELRVCDAVVGIDDVVALAALSQCLVARAMLDDAPLPAREVMAENRWRAMRYGVDCEFIVNDAGDVQHVEGLVEDLVQSLLPMANELECVDDLERVLVMARGEAQHQQQRVIFGELGLNQMMETMVVQW